MKLNTTLKLMAAVLTVALSPFAQATQTEVPGVAAQPDSFFYTGKPYDADLGAYTFAARNYDPELNRWTSADPSGFPDGANGFAYVSNKCMLALDPDGLTFLYYTGGRAGELQVWSGNGWSYNPNKVRGDIDWGEKQQSWSAVSGSNKLKPINSGWWDVVGEFSPLGWDQNSAHRPEYDYMVGDKGTQYYGTGNGAQGSMSLWAPAGYAYGSVEFKQHLNFINGRGYEDPDRRGISIHPDGPVFGVTAGCIGISEYQDAVQVRNFLSTFIGELYVE